MASSTDLRQMSDSSKRRNAKTEEDQEIDLIELLYRLIEKAKYIIAAAVLGAVLSGIYTFFLVTPIYTATAKLYVLNNSNAAIDLSALQVGTQLAADYKEVFSNWHVHEMVIEELDLPYSYDTLNRMVSVSNADSSRILHIKVTSTSPDEAKLLADTYAHVAQEFIAETMSTERPNIFEEALRPTRPSYPSKSRNIIIGFLVGFMAASAVIVVQFLVDDRIRSEEMITKYLDLSVLGMMPDLRAVSHRNAKKQNPFKRGISFIKRVLGGRRHSG